MLFEVAEEGETRARFSSGSGGGLRHAGRAAHDIDGGHLVLSVARFRPVRGVWPDLTLWFVFALSRNGFVAEATRWLERIYATMEGGQRAQHRARRVRRMVRRRFADGIAACTCRRGPVRSTCGWWPRPFAASTATGGAAGPPRTAGRLEVGGRRSRALGARAFARTSSTSGKIMFGNMREANGGGAVSQRLCGQRRER